jgi:hypothetical protein
VSLVTYIINIFNITIDIIIDVQHNKEVVVSKTAYAVLFFLFSSVGVSGVAEGIEIEAKEDSRFVPKMMNYQGYLTDSLGVPIDDTLDMEFRIYPVESGGNNLWAETHTSVPIVRGVFHVLLGNSTPIPDSVFTGGTDRWLQFTVDAQTVSPRTRITSSGYAYMATYSDTAEYARNVDQDNDWTSTDSVLFTVNRVGIARGGANNVLHGSLQYTHVNLGAVACTTGFSGGDRTGCTVLGGNYNLARGVHAVVAGGSTNRAQAYFSFIGGGLHNTANGWGSAVCGGDSNYVTGYLGFIGGGYRNACHGDYSAVLGGYADTLTSTAHYSYLLGINSNLTADSTFMVDMPHIRFGSEASGYEFPAVDGSVDQVLVTDGSGQLGWDDLEDNDWSVTDSVLYTGSFWGLARGGADNAVYSTGSAHTHVNFGRMCTTGTNGADFHSITIGGGSHHTADSNWSTVSGGLANDAVGAYSAIGGGAYHEVYGRLGVIGGGYENTLQSVYGGIFSGLYNEAGDNATADTGIIIAGGVHNDAWSDYSFIGGGRRNAINEAYGVICGGDSNSIVGLSGVIVGGHENTVGDLSSDTAAIVVGGWNNAVTEEFSAIVGGQGNSVSHFYSFLGGGKDNTVSGYYAGMLGGNDNTVAGPHTILGGGRSNYVAGEYASILGGFQNTTNATYATIGGGYRNHVEGEYSAILGGYADTISSGANYSYLFGISSTLSEDSTFMVDMPHIWFGDEINGYEFPVSDGSADQILVTDGSGQLSWSNMEDSDWIIVGDTMYANVNGNIGIGTTSPDQDLHVQKPDFAFMKVESDTHWAGVTIDKGDASDNGYVVYKTDGVDQWVFGTVGDEKMKLRYWPGSRNIITVQTDGNVGINTDTPAGNFTVANPSNEAHIHLYRPDNTYATVFAFTTGSSQEWTLANGSGTDNLYLTRGAGSSGDVYMCYGAPKIHVGTYTADDHKLNVLGYTSGHAAVRGADQSGSNVYAEGQLGVLSVSGLPYNPMNIGVLGMKPNLGSDGVAVYGWNNDAGTNNHALYAICDGSGTTNYGIYSKATNGGTNWAGYFDGDVNINGDLTVSGGLPEDNDWTRGTPDSVLFTTNLVGISRGSANNMFYGDSVYSHINLGVVCTTGMSGPASRHITISGGYGNKAMISYGSIGGGCSNVVHGTSATIAGGYENNANLICFVGGGQYNSAGPNIINAATIGGGDADTVKGRYGSILGGYSNLAGDEDIDTAVVITGGWDNSATAKYAFIGGGKGNSTSSGYSVLGGGFNNSITASYCGVIVGGADNSVDGGYASVIGGRYNQADGGYSLAAGYHAVANHNGSFVWGDESSSSDFTTTNTNQFLIRAANGVGIGTNSPITALHVAGNGAMGSAFTPNSSNANNILNLIVGSTSNGAINGISFQENTAGYDMKIGYNGVGSGDANMIEFYDSNDDPIMSIQNGGSVVGYGDAGSNNFYLSNLSGYGDNGYIAVGDNAGAIQASMYVNASGDGVVTGDIKSFHTDNPSQPGTEIWYACIEGPEAAAYVRGTGHLINGRAVIELPQHFKDVANPGSMTVQLTPLSAESRGLAVIEKNIDGIVVRELTNGTGSYDFDYMVVAVRKGYEDFKVIRPGSEHRPEISRSTSGSDY